MATVEIGKPVPDFAAQATSQAHSWLERVLTRAVPAVLAVQSRRVQQYRW